MVQVLGTTYRIVERLDRCDVVRVLDDELVGAFRHRPALKVVESKIDTGVLLGVAREALRQARVSWFSDSDGSPQSSSWLTGIHAQWSGLLDLLISSLSGLPVLAPAPWRSPSGAAVATGRSKASPA